MHGPRPAQNTWHDVEGLQGVMPGVTYRITEYILHLCHSTHPATIKQNARHAASGLTK